MTTFKPIYRARIFAPRSVDGTENTILTPAAGAPHTDKFCVASKSGVVDGDGNVYQPYLHRGPRGRSSQIDPLDKGTDIGEYTWTLVDKRTGAGNLQRWVTAFVGDGHGGNQLTGVRFEVDESLDGGTSWNRFSTSRVETIRSASNSKVLWEIAVRDTISDLENDIFFGPPHANVSSYAHHAQVAPIGLLRPYGDFQKVLPITANVAAHADGSDFRLDVVKTQNEPYRTIVTKALLDLQNYGGGGDYGRGDVWIAPVGTPIGDPGWVRYDFFFLLPYRSTSIESIWARPQRGTSATPASGVTVDFYVETRVGSVTESLPFLINDVHPIRLLKDMLSGYFGRLSAAGEVTWSVPYNAANFATFEADATFRKVRFIETKRAELHEWITENILRPNLLALSVNASGELEIVDFRSRGDPAPVFTLSNADLVSGKDSVSWETVRADAIAGITMIYFGERYIENGELPKPFEARDPGNAQDYNPPDIPTIRIEESSDFPVKLARLGPRALDVVGREHEIKCRGLRFRDDGSHGEADADASYPYPPKKDALRSYCTAIASDLMGPFGLGPTMYTIIARRGSEAVSALGVGSTGLVGIDL